MSVAVYLVKRGSVWHYKRRVPQDVAHKDRRQHVRRTTRKRYYQGALHKASLINRECAAWWDSLRSVEYADSIKKYQTVSAQTRAFGFDYQPFDETSPNEIEDELAKRVNRHPELTR